MLKYKKVLWLALMVLAALIFAGSLGFVIYLAATDWVWIPGIVLILAAAGGFVLGFYALVAYRQLLPQLSASVEAKAKKDRQLAQEAMAQQLSRIDRLFSRCLTLFVLLVCAVFFLWAYFQAHNTELILTNPATGGESERALVLSVDSEDYRGSQDLEDRPVGSQYVTVEFETGTLKGQQFRLKNDLSVWYGTVLKAGDRVIVGYSTEDGKPVGNMVISDYDRTIPLLIMLGLFMLITVLVGGKIGLKSLLGLGLTFVCMFSILIPLLLSGWPTIPTILGMCALVTVVEFVVLDGVNKKTLCAILGTLSGVVLAAVFAAISESLLRVNGYNLMSVDSMIEDLGNHKLWQQMVNGDVFASLQLSDLLVGGILIAALGAVNDVAMSISSAMNELITVNPELTRKELFKSGMNIGRDMVGTMTNTLILAVAGSSFVLMIFYTIMDPSWNMVIDSPMLPVEVLQAAASSAGVILAVPVSVIIGMFLYGHSGKKAK